MMLSFALPTLFCVPHLPKFIVPGCYNARTIRRPCYPVNRIGIEGADEIAALCFPHVRVDIVAARSNILALTRPCGGVDHAARVLRISEMRIARHRVPDISDAIPAA